FRVVALRCGGGSQSAVADRLLRGERASRACPCRPARALRRRPVCLPHAEGNGAQNLPQLSEADRRQISRARMVRRQILRGRSLRLRVLYLGRAARAADGRAQELHGVQGSHAQACGGQTRRRRREGQGLSGASAAARANTVGADRPFNVSCFTLGPAARAYAGDVTERSVMVVVVLPSPSWAFPPSTRPRRAPPAGPFCEKVSRARSAAPQGRSRPSSRAMGVRCRHRSRVYPRSAFKCAQVGFTRLAWTATVPHGL